MKQVQQRPPLAATPKAKSQTQTAPARRAFVPASNHRDAGPCPPAPPSMAGAALDVAGVVEQARSAPRVALPHARRLAREFDISLNALEVHQGEAARLACARIGARAFAVQNVVAFAEEAPSVSRVRHELAHVVQQGGPQRAAPARYAPGSLSLAARDSRPEREAAAVAQGRARGQLSAASVAVYRADGDDVDTEDAARAEGEPQSAQEQAEKKTRFKTALGRLVNLAKKAPKLPDNVSKDDTRFGISNGKSDTEEEFDPIFLESSKESWKLKDYRDEADEKGPITDAAAQGDLSARIFKRNENGTLHEEALARQPILADGKYWWVSRVIGKDMPAEANPDAITTSYAFVGRYLTKASSNDKGQAIGAKDQNDKYAVVNDKKNKPWKKTDPADSLAAYMTIVEKIEDVARAKSTGLAPSDDLKTAIKTAQGKTAQSDLEQGAKDCRVLLKAWILDSYKDVDKLYDQIFNSKVFPPAYKAIQGDVFIGFIATKAGQNVEVGTNQVYFGDNVNLKIKPSADLKKLRRGDGFVKISGGYRILEGKAVTEAPKEEQLDQIVDYAVIISNGIQGYLLEDGKIVDENKFKAKFSAVEYYLPSTDPENKVAKQWDEKLNDAFKAKNKLDGYIIHPKVGGKDATETAISLNPTISIPITKPEQIDQTAENVKVSQPGVTIKKVDFKLVRAREAEIASGKIFLSVDMKGAVSSPETAKAKTLNPIAATAAKPAKPGGPIVYGSVENKFGNLKSKLDDFLKRVKTDAKLVDDGVEASLWVTPGPSGIPGVNLDEALVKATLGRAGLKAEGKVGLSNEKGTVKGGLEISWSATANKWGVKGRVTFTDLVDGLKPIDAHFEYDAASGTTKIWADKVAIEKKFNAVTLTGTATNLLYDATTGQFSGKAALKADLGAFGEATAAADISANQIAGAELVYKSPHLKYPKTSPALEGDLSGTVTYTAPKTPGGEGTFTGGITVDAVVKADVLKKLSKTGKLAVGGEIKITEKGYSGSIGTKDALELGTHFRIPPFQADVAEDGTLALAFALEIVDVAALKDAKVGLSIDDKGFHIVGANVEVKFGSDKDKAWGGLAVIYKPGAGPASGLTIGGTLNVKIKEGLVATGTATYNTQTDKVDTKLTVPEIQLLKYGPKEKELFAIKKQIELISFYKIIGLYLDMGFVLKFEYGFDLRLQPQVSLEAFSLKDYSFGKAKAMMKLLGKMAAKLIGTPNIGLGLFVLSTKLLRGGGGIKVPIAGTAELKLQPPITVEVTYTPEGGVSAGGTAGLTLTFGVAGSVNPYAEFSVLDGAYNPKWEGEALASFTLLKERPIFTYVVNFGQPLTTDTSPEIPVGQETPARPTAEKNLTSQKASPTQTAVDTTKAPDVGTPDAKPAAKNEGGFDLMGMVSGLVNGESFRPIKSILDAAGEVWDAITGFIGRIIKFIRNWVGGAIDIVTKALKGIKAKGLFGYMKELLKEKLHPAVYDIIEPMLTALSAVEEDVMDLLDTKLPTSMSGLLGWAMTVVKKVIKLGWDSLSGLISAIKEMASRAGAAAVRFIKYLIEQGRLGVRRHGRYIGSETVGLTYDFLLADEYKLIDVGGVTLGPTVDDSVWPSADKAIGFGLWHLLHDVMEIEPTDKRIYTASGESYDDYWVGRISRKARSSGGRVSPDAPHAVRDAAEQEDGMLLPPLLQSKYEAKLGADLSGVRLHTGAASAAAAAALDARAYTVGRHIHFGAGEYAPWTPAGELLLAHEVAHAAWTPRSPRVRYGIEISSPHDVSERRADGVARALTAAPLGRVGPGLPISATHGVATREAFPERAYTAGRGQAFGSEQAAPLSSPASRFS